MPRTLEVGLLLSTDCTYKSFGRNALAGALHAIAEINASPGYDFSLRATHVNPRGQLHRYGEGAVQMMQAGIRHLFGAPTSASRKEIIPDLEQNSGLLWYACPYEGFESSENVLYLGPCPNQTLIPLLRYALRAFGCRAMLVGSNYIWGWESNRLAREVLAAAGGEVLGERYFHFGTCVFGELIQNLLAQHPSFVMNNLVGESSYAFLRQLDAACQQAGLRLPVLSCNLTEAELAAVGPVDSLRLLSCGTFFEAVNPTFTQQQRRLHGLHPYSHFYTGAYLSMHLLAQAFAHCGDDAPQAICQTLYQQPQPSVLGPLEVCERNNHCSLPCHIAELQQGRFVLLHSEARALPADPYLTATDLSEFHGLGVVAPTQHLRIIK
ncbi:transporter substrate-binding protein [Pseudomonas sp. Fl5BN2]|uniref:transporter substrate-binding protein n=1 Tax=Pseudomonas sp. Fl5BN2 TaxID=2697652 RepID=UPI001377E933|nr:transporter substrate-binding protein [Pseudomonas sp. Fl5BN2]NBF03075.1 transporter substrate-binding protein [Pseudomonas sp. Fl5BN2]